MQHFDNDVYRGVGIVYRGVGIESRCGNRDLLGFPRANVPLRY